MQNSAGGSQYLLFSSAALVLVFVLPHVIDCVDQLLSHSLYLLELKPGVILSFKLSEMRS
jgi:hypothetical protein